MIRLKPLLTMGFVAAVLLVALTTAAEACPTCKLALESNSGERDLVSAYMYSILFMMLMPFTLLGSFATYMYYQVRRARAAQAVGMPTTFDHR